MKRKISQAAKQTTGLPIPKKGSNYRKLYLANSKLAMETTSLTQLPQLAKVTASLRVGQIRLGTGIKLLAQKQELTAAFYKIKTKKNNELTKAFAKVFDTTAVITFVNLPLTLLTDRSREEERW